LDPCSTFPGPPLFQIPGPPAEFTVMACILDPPMNCSLLQWNVPSQLPRHKINFEPCKNLWGEIKEETLLAGAVEPKMVPAPPSEPDLSLN